MSPVELANTGTEHQPTSLPPCCPATGRENWPNLDASRVAALTLEAGHMPKCELSSREVLRFSDESRCCSGNISRMGSHRLGILPQSSHPVSCISFLLSVRARGGWMGCMWACSVGFPRRTAPIREDRHCPRLLHHAIRGPVSVLRPREIS